MIDDILKKAKEKVEQGWTQGTFAADASGHPVPPKHPDATCWCAAGAIQYASSLEKDLDACVGTLESVGRFGIITAWNDAPARTQKDVVQLFDDAIASLGEPVEVKESSQIDDRIAHYRDMAKKGLR